MLFAKVIIYYNMTMKYAEKHKKRPDFDEGGVLCRAKRLRR